MNPLSELAKHYVCDKGESRINGHESHKFTLIYYELFNPIKDEVKNVLEICINRGDSLRMWRDFFPNATIYGVDDKRNCLFTDDRIVTWEGSQEVPLAIKHDIENLKRKFDIIIDDGSHRHEHQQKTLSALFKFLKPGGLYVVEDLHCAFYPEYGLEADDADTTLNFLKRYINKGVLSSKFFTRQQVGALRRMIGDCTIYDFPRAHNRGGKSIVGVLVRK